MLHLNGWCLDYEEEAAVDFMIGVAIHEIGLQGAILWLRKHSRPIEDC